MLGDKSKVGALRNRRKLKNRVNTPRWPEDDTNIEVNESSVLFSNGKSSSTDRECTTLDKQSSRSHHKYANTFIAAAATTYRPPTESTDFDDDNNLESSGDLNDEDNDDRDGDVESETKAIQSKNSMLCNEKGVNASQTRLIGRRRRLIHQRRCNKSNLDTDHDGDVDNDDDDSDNDDCDESDSIDDNNNISSETNEDVIDDAKQVTISNTRCVNPTFSTQSKTVSFLRSRMVSHHSRQQQQSSIKGERKFAASDLKNVSKATKINNHILVTNEKQQALLSSQNGRARQEHSPGIGQSLAEFFRRKLNLFSDNKSFATKQDSEEDKIIDIELNDRDQLQRQQQLTAGGIMSSSNRYMELQGDNNYSARRKSSLKQKFTEAQYLEPKGYSRLGNYVYRLSDKNESIFQVLKRFLLLLLIICISCLLLWKLYQNLTEEYNYLGLVESPSVRAELHSYAVSTDAKPCAKVGAELLAQGGSAIDAAIGTLICMSVAIPNSMGIGGGCFMTIYDAKKKESIAIDGRETAPDYAKEGMFANESLAASRGPLSVGIPGELAAYWKAHQMYGKLPWSHLFNRSIDMAENGSPVVEHLAIALRTKSHAKYITPTMANFFLNATTGEYLNHGDILVQKQYAETLKRIRDNGVTEFYGGKTGQLFIEDLKKQGGQITMDNLVKYEAQLKKALSFKLADDLTLHTQPLPASGPVLAIILRVMKELGYYGARPQNSMAETVLYYHRLMETFKFAYGQRAALEDMPDDPKRLSKLLERLESEAFIKETANKIDNRTHGLEYYGAKQYFQEDHGTAHVSVLDAEGNAAAITTSVNLYFGSGLISPSTGIVYNDIMDDFVSTNMANKFGLAPSNYNRIRPGRRPLSSMAPSVFTDANGNVKLVIGASGGSMITTSIATVSLRNCFLKEDIKTAIDGPRIHHQYLPDYVQHEHNFSKEILRLLVEEYGHNIQQIKGRSSVVMAIAAKYHHRINDTTTTQQTTTNKIITANSDYRKGGSVDGS